MVKIRNVSYTIKLNGTELASKLGINTKEEHVDKVDVKLESGLVVVSVACTIEEKDLVGGGSCPPPTPRSGGPSPLSSSAS